MGPGLDASELQQAGAFHNIGRPDQWIAGRDVDANLFEDPTGQFGSDKEADGTWGLVCDL